MTQNPNTTNMNNDNITIVTKTNSEHYDLFIFICTLTMLLGGTFCGYSTYYYFKQ